MALDSAHGQVVVDPCRRDPLGKTGAVGFIAPEFGEESPLPVGRGFGFPSPDHRLQVVFQHDRSHPGWLGSRQRETDYVR